MEISVVTLSANGSSGSNTQIMMRVVSLEEELLDVLRVVTAGARWPWLSSRPDQALRRPHGQIQGNRYRRVPHAETDDVEVVACGFLRGLRSLSRLQWALS